MTVNVNIPFENLLQAIRNLDTVEKQQLSDFLAIELDEDTGDDQEEIEVNQAYQEYETGNYVTLDQYHTCRLSEKGEASV